MSSQVRTVSGSELARAFGVLERMASIVRENNRTAAAGRRLQIPAYVSFAKHSRGLETGSRIGKGIASGGSQSRTDGKPERMSIGRLFRNVAALARSMRAVAHAADGVRNNKETKRLATAMAALIRAEHSVATGRAGRAISTANERAMLPVVASAQLARRSRIGIEAERVGRAGTGLIASARVPSSIRGLAAPSSVSQREFAEPSGNATGPNSGIERASITINSSPTVVINAQAAGGDAQRDVLGALRAHREELFDQLKRESARRERAQF
jgi:hypothetical protein